MLGWLEEGPLRRQQFPRVTSDVKRSKQPIEAKLLQIVLRDLDEFRLYLDLLRPSYVCLFNQCIYQFQIIDRVANNKAAALRQEVCARSRWKGNALTLEKLARAFAIDQQLSSCRLLSVFTRAGWCPGRSGLCCSLIERAYPYVYRAAYEPRRDAIFFCR